MNSFPSLITETLVTLPKSSISVELMVRTEDQYRSLFKEIKRKDGWQLSFCSSEYLVFKYNDTENFESVLVSYFQLATLKEGFQEIKEFLDKALIYNEEAQEYGIHPDYKQGYKLCGMIKDKSLGVVPEVRRLDNGQQEVGCNFLINDPEKSGFVSFDTMMQLCAFIKDFDLYTSSKIMINSALWYCDMKNNSNILNKEAYVPNKEALPKH